MVFRASLRGIADCCSGLWSFLTARTNGRAAVALEREKNNGTAQLIPLLPPGIELVEGGASGFRVIRMPQELPAPPTVVRHAESRPAGELTE